MPRKPKPKAKPPRRSRIQKEHPARRKLDSRLALLLSLPEKKLRSLKTDEDKRLLKLLKDVEEAVVTLDQARDTSDRDSVVKRLKELDRQLFAPITTGLFIPPETQPRKPWPIRMKEAFISAFILSDASADDLKRLGVLVRSQVGDIFSTFIPLSAIAKIEASAAVRYIELARPLFRTLDQAVPYAQLDTLHNAMVPIDGTGVVVGVIDTRLDIYHPDFRTAANATRV